MAQQPLGKNCPAKALEPLHNLNSQGIEKWLWLNFWQSKEDKSQSKQRECNCMAKSQGSEIKDSKGRPSVTAKSSADSSISLPAAGKEPSRQVKHISRLCLKRLLKRSRDFVSPSYVMKDVPQRHLFHIAFVRWWQYSHVMNRSAGSGVTHSHLGAHTIGTMHQSQAEQNHPCSADGEVGGAKKASHLWRNLGWKLLQKSTVKIMWPFMMHLHNVWCGVHKWVFRPSKGLLLAPAWPKSLAATLPQPVVLCVIKSS